jgi:serine/threonine protein kinase
MNFSSLLLVLSLAIQLACGVRPTSLVGPLRRFKIISSNHGITVAECQLAGPEGKKLILKFANDETDNEQSSAVYKEIRAYRSLEWRLDAAGIDKKLVNIVFPVAFESKTAAMAFPYYPLGDLKDYYDNNEFDIDTELAWIARGVLQALEVLHDPRINMPHNDIKLENIIITDTSAFGYVEQVKLIDFGLAGSKRTICGRFYGTNGYFAPDIIARIVRKKCSRFLSDVGKAADIWALGVTLYRLIYRDKPLDLLYDEDREDEYMFLQRYRHAYDGVRLKIKQDKNLSRDAKDFLLKLLKWNRNKRITAAEALEHPFITQLPYDHDTPRGQEYKEKRIMQKCLRCITTPKAVA